MKRFLDDRTAENLPIKVEGTGKKYQSTVMVNVRNAVNLHEKGLVRVAINDYKDYFSVRYTRHQNATSSVLCPPLSPLPILDHHQRLK